jgi:hypothetical protein
MIQKYYKKGVIQVAVSIGLFIIGFFILGSTYAGNYKNLGECLCVILSLISTVIGLFGCSELLRAKGYDTSIMLAFLIPGICCSGVFILLAPFVIIYGLKDKTRNRPN